jgi:hypothetical protein
MRREETLSIEKDGSRTPNADPEAVRALTAFVAYPAALRVRHLVYAPRAVREELSGQSGAER